MKKQVEWSVYIIRCRDNSLYTGISNDVERRFSEHADQAKRCARYLRGRGPLELVFQADVGSRTKALKMERRIKKMSKADKEKLVAGEWDGGGSS
jgi:putative endonuclease